MAKKYLYYLTCPECQASKTDKLVSALGTDPDYDPDAETVEYQYETDTPLQIGELVSTRGRGCYEIRAIFRWVDVEQKPSDESSEGVLADSNQDFTQDGQHIFYALTREVDYIRIIRGKSSASL